MKLSKVRVGEWDTQSNIHEIEPNKHQDRSIGRLIIHPNHNNGSMFNDVALIELETPLKLYQHVNTICIPGNEKQLNYDSQSCVSTGWGKDGYGK